MKEARESNAPSIYDERLLDSSGVYDPDFLDKEKMRIVDSIYNEGRITYTDRTYRSSTSEIGPERIERDSVPKVLEDTTEIESKELALEHQLFFASNPLRNDKLNPKHTDSILYARVDGTQTVQANFRLRMRLTKPARINNKILPRHTPIYGFVAFKPNRTIITIENIDHQLVKLKAFDVQDGSEGIYIENSFRAEASQEIIGDVVDDINIVGVPQVGGVKRIFQRNNRNVKVTVMDNYKLILKADHRQ